MIVSIDRDTIYFLVTVFVLSIIVEYYIILCHLSGDYMYFQVLLLLLMYMPVLSTSIIAVLIRGENLSKYDIKIGDLKLSPIAYIYPLVSILIAAVIMSILGFHIDWELAYLKEKLAQYSLSLGLTPDDVVEMLIMNSIIAPFFNMIFAVGEEVGWRGYLLSKFMEKNSIETSLIFVGIIWALWHAPLIIFIGYNYPSLRIYGLFLFIPFCISHGIILAWLRIKSGGILLPALGHGAVNAFGWLGAYLYPNNDLLNLLVGIPGIIVSSILATIAYYDLKKVFSNNSNTLVLS
ncbi:MAG: CPBP family intramembrane glutamic endopeptidase [Candidatus Njordarchaeota archaeon]